MKEYKELQTLREKMSTIAGVVVTIVVHTILIGSCFFTGIKYLDPPPPETSLVIDFSEIEEAEIKPEPTRQGREPQAEEIDKEKEIELIKKSESNIKGEKANQAQESIVDDHGDVDINQPERKKEINKKSLFPSADNQSDKDTLAAQTASKVSEILEGGHASGNTQKGKYQGEPNAQLKGRNLLGTIPTPSYNGQKDAIVVVKIWVDQYGKVTDAFPGEKGTTVADKKLWAASRNAALKAHFNMSANAPVKQEGTITFVFKITK